MVFGHHRHHHASRSQPQGEFVEVLYEFKPQNSGDLHVRPGDKVEILERLSPDWYRGRCNGKEGMVPANYVRPLGGGSGPAVPAPAPQAVQSPPQQQQQGQPMVVQQDRPKRRNNIVGRFGSKLGNAVIFGVGATLGNDLVDSIF